jgi:hypothetical protein
MERALGWGALVAVALLAVAGAASAGSEKRPVLRIAVTSGGQVTTSDGRVRCSDRCSARYRRGAVRRLTAKPDANFIFDRWEGACIGAAPICDVALDRTTSVRAKFVGTPTTLLVSVGGPGTLTSPSGLDCGAPAGACRAQVPYASSVTLKPVPNEDGRFGAWNGDGPCATAGSGPCTLRIESPRTEVAAAFGHSAPQSGPQPLTVTIEPPSGARVTSQPAGIDCQPAGAASFASGTVVMLQMSTSDFWPPACYGDLDRCLLVVDAPTEVRVRLRPPTVPSFTTPKGRLEVTVSGGGLITSSDGAIRCGWAPSAQTSCSEDSGLGPTETRQLRAKKQGQRRFFRWGGFCRGARPKCTVTMTRRSNQAVQPFPVTGLFRRR